MYLRQIRVPKPAQPTIRPFPRFVLNLVSCVKKVMQICCDLDMWRHAQTFAPSGYYPPFFLFYKLSKYLLLLNCSGLSSNSHPNLVVIHYHPASTFSDHTGPESYHREHGELFGSGRAAWTIEHKRHPQGVKMRPPAFNSFDILSQAMFRGLSSALLRQRVLCPNYNCGAPKYQTGCIRRRLWLN